MFFLQNPMPVYIPKAKAWGLDGKIDNLSELIARSEPPG